MVNLRRRFLAAILFTTLFVYHAFAQSTLTQILDTIHNPDGSTFKGTVVITWNGFSGTGGGSVSKVSVSARIFNGALSVFLAPTTTATTGTYYQVAYSSSNGLVTYNETWQVPPSATPLTVSQVRVSSTTGASSGSGPGVQYVTLPIAISQVTNLSADLSSINGSVTSLTSQVNDLASNLSTLTSTVNGNTTSLTGLNTSVGDLNTSVTNLGNSLTALTATVNTLSASGSSAVFVDAETPGGTMNGANTAFTLANPPAPATSLKLFRNGLLQQVNIDFTLSGSAITFLAGSVPQAADYVRAYYRTPGTGTGTSFNDAELPSGTINGTNLTFTLAATPNPAASLALFKNGVLLTQGADYVLSGATVSFANTTVAPQVGDSLTASYRH